MDDSIILEELSNLISDGNYLRKVLRVSNNLSTDRVHNKKHDQKATKWKGSAINLLKLRFGENSCYYKDFNNAVNYNSEAYAEFSRENVQKATGILEFIYGALKKGLTDDLFYKKEILILSDLLDQAYEFLKIEQKLASGIYGRIVLETTIKEFAEKNNIHETKFDQLIIKLRTNNIIHKPFENILRANYEIGSWAAHGNIKFENLSDYEIKEFLNFIRDRVLTLE